MKLAQLIAAGAMVCSMAAQAQTSDIAELYRGKTVTFLINFTPGGSTDVEGRVLARHLGAHIPGKPTVVVQNMGGAGGSIGTNYLGQVSKPDGLTLGYLTASVGKQALGESELRIDLKGLEFLGNVPDVNITYMRTDVPPGIAVPGDVMKARGFWIGTSPLIVRRILRSACSSKCWASSINICQATKARRKRGLPCSGTKFSFITRASPPTAPPSSLGS